MFERFTERARQVVVLAQEEASVLHHDYIGTEHLLLGLLKEGGADASVLVTLPLAGGAEERFPSLWSAGSCLRLRSASAS
jgi:ATP-dependent Clp protease ATP-binding subunit ClpC